MKRFVSLLCLIALIVSVTPVQVHAEENSGHYSTAFGTIDWEIKDESAETKSKTWVFYLTPNKNYKSIELQLTPVNLTNLQPVPSSSFLLADKKVDEMTGIVTVSLIVGNSNGLTAGQKTEMMTVTSNYTSTDNCRLSLSLGTISCVQLGGIYIDANGASVTEAEYNEVCGNKPEVPNDVPNSDTGSVVPYVAVGGGIVAIAGVFLYSKKSKRMYRI
ncbi:MAG: hypothetical protein K2J20_05355 [Bacilli bacterium]|nr:hypothetical protein [Bacilli bacterium]